MLDISPFSPQGPRAPFDFPPFLMNVVAGIDIIGDVSASTGFGQSRRVAAGAERLMQGLALFTPATNKIFAFVFVSSQLVVLRVLLYRVYTDTCGQL